MMQETNTPTLKPRSKIRPWSTMEIGDSFFVPASQAMPSSIRCAASAKGADLGRMFSVHRTDTGVVVTRVE